MDASLAPECASGGPFHELLDFGRVEDSPEFTPEFVWVVIIHRCRRPEQSGTDIEQSLGDLDGQNEILGFTERIQYKRIVFVDPNRQMQGHDMHESLLRACVCVKRLDVDCEILPCDHWPVKGLYDDCGTCCPPFGPSVAGSQHLT